MRVIKWVHEVRDIRIVLVWRKVEREEVGVQAHPRSCKRALVDRWKRAWGGGREREQHSHSCGCLEDGLELTRHSQTAMIDRVWRGGCRLEFGKWQTPVTITYAFHEA